MTKQKILILVLFISAAALILFMKSKPEEAIQKPVTTTDTVLPKLLELGSTSCIPCKMMVPILDTLRKEQAGNLSIEFLDVWKDREAGKRYGVRTIPTQIIFDNTGAELFRHEGFWSRQDIENKLKELHIIRGTES